MIHGTAALITSSIDVLATLAVTNTNAGDPKGSKDLSSYACKDVMRLSGAERDIALALLHGYRLGKKDTTQFETGALARATDSFLDYCLDHPDENALAAFAKVAK